MPLEQGCTYEQARGEARPRPRASYTGAQAGSRQAGRGLHREAKRLASHHRDHDDPPTYAHHAAEEARDAACIAAPDRVDLVSSEMRTLQAEDKATAGAQSGGSNATFYATDGQPKEGSKLGHSVGRTISAAACWLSCIACR